LLHEVRGSTLGRASKNASAQSRTDFNNEFPFHDWFRDAKCLNFPASSTLRRIWEGMRITVRPSNHRRIFRWFSMLSIFTAMGVSLAVNAPVVFAASLGLLVLMIVLIFCIDQF